MRDSRFKAGDSDPFARRDFRTEEEFKEAIRSGVLPWTEIQRYYEWRKSEIKDCRFEIRISSIDLMKLKALARMQGKKYQTYIGEILKREIHGQEDRMADKEPETGVGAPA